MPVAKPQRSAPLPLSHAVPETSAGAPAPRVVAPMADEIGEWAGEWAASPAKLLHERLVATFAPPSSIADAAAPGDERLSPRARLGIILGSCALLWLGIGGVVAAAIL